MDKPLQLSPNQQHVIRKRIRRAIRKPAIPPAPTQKLKGRVLRARARREQAVTRA